MVLKLSCSECTSTFVEQIFRHLTYKTEKNKKADSPVGLLNKADPRGITQMLVEKLFRTFLNQNYENKIPNNNIQILLIHFRGENFLNSNNNFIVLL